MISIISSTNRSNSYTRRVVDTYALFLERQGVEFQVVDLSELPRDVAFGETYGARSESFSKEFESKIAASEKFVFVMPEYNGGFPGILKLFVDAIPPKLFHGKKAGLVGCASGHAGALRPVDQFTNILNYLRVDVMANKPKLSGIDKAYEGDNMIDQMYLGKLEKHAEDIVRF
jgi:NAD(P)H-dependent FMN reductase